MNQQMPRIRRGWPALLLCSLVVLACSLSNTTVIRGGTPTPVSGTAKVQTGQVGGPTKVVGAQYPSDPLPIDPEHEQAQVPPLPIGPNHPRKGVDPPLQVVVPNKPLAFTAPAHGLTSHWLSVPGRPASDVVVSTDSPFASALSRTNDGEETSEASSGDVVFFTGNWFAAYSVDGGATFTYVNPSTVFPDPAGSRFCCDQVVHYVAQYDLFFWLIQYTKNSSAGNTDRLAIASPATLRTTGATGWYYYDFTPSMFNLSGMWLDFPDLALGSNTLYWTTNVFKQVTNPDGSLGDQGQGSMISFLPLAALARGDGFGFGFVYRSDGETFTAAQNTGAHGFWASHITTSQLRVFDWVEGAGIYSWHDLDVASWNNSAWGTVVHDPITLSGTDAGSVAWNTNHKLSVDDGRVRGAALVGDEVWFAWAAGSDGQYTEPHIEIARVSTSSVALVGQRVIWNPEHAFARPSLTSNSAGEAGMAYMWGGGGRYNGNSGIAILTGTAEGISVALSAVGTPWWGDYVTVRQDAPDTSKFTAGVFGIDTCSSCNGGFRNDPYFVVFGRS